MLHRLLDGSGYSFWEKQNLIIIGRDPEGNKAPSSHLFAGIIEDKETGTRLEGVAVYDPGKNMQVPLPMKTAISAYGAPAIP